MAASKRVILICVLLPIISFVLISFLPAEESLERKDIYQVVHTAKLSKGDLSFDKFLGYDVVRLENGSYPDELGKPMLPSIQLRIALPAGMSAQSVQVVNVARKSVSGEFNVLPVQPPKRIGDSDQDAVFVEPDPEICSSDQPYPSRLVEFVHQADLAGQGIATVRLYPVQYVPTEKKLTFCTSISFVIRGVEGHEYSHYLSPNVSEKGRRTYEQMLKGMVVNPVDINLRTDLPVKSTALDGGPFDHVIITGTGHAAWYADLIEWHNQKGLRDTVVTTDWIYANYSGSTDQEKIRSFIIDANTEWGTIYFLLGGENETVPFEYRDYYAGESTPSDQYYSDFDDDWTNEVFVGRVTAETGFEIQTFVFKVLKYEKDPPRSDYILNALLIAGDEGSEDLKDIIDAYIPLRFDVIKSYQPPNNCDTVFSCLNRGQHLVNHAGLADPACLYVGLDCSICWSDVDSLTNDDKMSIVVSAGPYANQMDFEDCIAEHFVTHNPFQAGIAFTGNTRSAWTFPGQPDALSGKLDKEWWVSLFSRDKHNLGQTLVEAKHQFSHTASLEKHCEWTFNLLGEPEMPIWTDEPDSFAVICSDRLPKGRVCPVLVHVGDSTTHDPVDSAYACLWKGNEVYLTGYTDAGGNVTFDPTPSTEGIMYLTVTRHNYIPYQQEIEILPCVCGDANGDGVVNISDIVYEVNYLFRGGPSPDPIECADVNCDGVEDLADLVCKINFLYRGGPMPCDYIH